GQGPLPHGVSRPAGMDRGGRVPCRAARGGASTCRRPRMLDYAVRASLDVKHRERRKPAHADGTGTGVETPGGFASRTHRIPTHQTNLCPATRKKGEPPGSPGLQLQITFTRLRLES